MKFILVSLLSTLFATAIIVSIFYFFYRKKIKNSFKVELNDKINEGVIHHQYHQGLTGGQAGTTNSAPPHFFAASSETEPFSEGQFWLNGRRRRHLMASAPNHN